MEDATGLSCERFVEVLASKEPAPGGGGAAALVGAIGCALGNMVGALTVGKPKYAAVQQRVEALNAQARQLQQRLLELVAADARAFEPLAAAYGLPTGTPQERARKAEVMEGCLRTACEVPLQVMQAASEAIDLCAAYAECGSALALSDAGCGAVTCKAALQAASLNVFVNTASMADRAHARACDARAQQLLDEYCPRADAVFASVRERVA